MATIEPIGHTEFTAHKERETLRLKVNEIIEALNGISINNAKITLKQGSAIKGDFTLNQPIDKTIELDAGGSAGGFVWGEGTGTITNQTDLVNYIAEEIADEAELREEEDDTLASAINTLDGAVVKKTAIKTAIESTLTDDDVVSGKVIFNKLSKIETITTTLTLPSYVTLNHLYVSKCGKVVNVWCDTLNVSQATTGDVQIATGLPEPVTIGGAYMPSATAIARVQVLSGGKLTINATGAVTNGYPITFTYLAME